MLDAGSGVTLIKRNVAEGLGLIGKKVTMRLKWTDTGTEMREESLRTSIIVRAQDVDAIKLDFVHTIGDLDLPMQTQRLSEFSRYSHLNQLPIPEYVDAKPVMLIGLPHATHILSTDTRCEAYDEPVACKTSFGWAVYGNKVAGAKAGDDTMSYDTQMHDEKHNCSPLEYSKVQLSESTHVLEKKRSSQYREVREDSGTRM